MKKKKKGMFMMSDCQVVFSLDREDKLIERSRWLLGLYWYQLKGSEVMMDALQQISKDVLV